MLLLAQSLPMETTDGLKAYGMIVAPATYKGLKSVRVIESGKGGESLVLIEKLVFGDGSIELELAGAPGSNAVGGARGFVGIAFHVASDPGKYEAFYLRPTNGRADDQVRRNHSAQYISHPDYPWERLRKEFPEKYESYVDLESGAWTKIRVEVKGISARLFVHGQAQPTLIVNDLKLGATKGGIALWIGPGTEAHFRNLHVRADEQK